jgi:D-alanine-D-alanine ligase
VRSEITIIYNEPSPIGSGAGREDSAVLGVLEAVDAVNLALIERGYLTTCLPLVPPVESVREQLQNLKTDLIFNLFEGFFDYPESEAEVAYILEDLHFTFTGCHSRALALALDKAESKAMLAANGIGVPGYQVLTPHKINKFNLKFPCIVKPRCQDASHGISQDSVVNDLKSLRKQVQRISELFSGEALVEEFMEGREFNITVFGGNELVVLPVSEIVYSLPENLPKILTFEAKWDSQSEYFRGTSVECPARIDESLRKKIEDIAIATFHIFGCSGYARVDLRMDSKKELKVMEVNPNPDTSPDTGGARQASAFGMSYSQFIEKIVLFSLEEVPV